MRSVNVCSGSQFWIHWKTFFEGCNERLKTFNKQRGSWSSELPFGLAFGRCFSPSSLWIHLHSSFKSLRPSRSTFRDCAFPVFEYLVARLNIVASQIWGKELIRPIKIQKIQGNDAKIKREYRNSIIESFYLSNHSQSTFQ